MLILEFQADMFYCFSHVHAVQSLSRISTSRKYQASLSRQRVDHRHKLYKERCESLPCRQRPLLYQIKEEISGKKRNDLSTTVQMYNIDREFLELGFWRRLYVKCTLQDSLTTFVNKQTGEHLENCTVRWTPQYDGQVILVTLLNGC